MPCFGPPKKCCTCRYQPATQADECRCGCGYLNGVWQALTAQILAFCGIFLSLATLGDCSFVEIANPIQVRENPDVFATRLGFLSYQLENGTCYFWADGEDTEEQVRFYLDVALGPDWRPSIILAMVAWILSVLVFFYTTSFCCSAQVRRFRFFAGISISVVLPLVQGLSFLVLRSSWCDVEDCQSSRGGDFCIMAVILFFLAGQCFFFMSNFPGAKYIEAMEQQGDVEMITVADAVVISEREVVIAPEDVISTEGVTFAEAVVLDPQHEEGDGSTEENHPAGAPNNVEKMTEPHEATANCAEQAVTEEVMVEEGEYSNDNGETQPGDDVVDVAEGEDIVERCETASPNDRPVTPSNTATTFGAAQDRQKAEKSHCDES